MQNICSPQIMKPNLWAYISIGVKNHPNAMNKAPTWGKKSYELILTRTKEPSQQQPPNSMNFRGTTPKVYIYYNGAHLMVYLCKNFLYKSYICNKTIDCGVSTIYFIWIGHSSTDQPLLQNNDTIGR